MTIYIVNGWMRSGTSMMMAALEAGGIEAVYDRDTCQIFESRFSDDDYHPNPGGLYELRNGELKNPEFVAGLHGKVVKCLRNGPKLLPSEHHYCIIQMRRDPEEIRQSCNAFFSQGISKKRDIEGVLASVRSTLRERNSVVIEVWYRDVIADPEREFNRIAEDLPIAPKLAASVVDPSLCRFKLEDLEVGVY